LSPGYVSFSMNNIVADELGISTCRCGDLMDCATRWVDRALTVAGCATSGRASVRLSCSRGCLFVEVTHGGPSTFDALMADHATMNAIEELRAWARDSAEALTIERGPLDQFRITVVVEPGAGKGCGGEGAAHGDPGDTDTASSLTVLDPGGDNQLGTDPGQRPSGRWPTARAL